MNRSLFFFFVFITACMLVTAPALLGLETGAEAAPEQEAAHEGKDSRVLQWSVNTVPYGTVPLGPSAGFFNLGFGVEASASFIPGFLRFFGAGAGSSFMLLPLETQNSVWTIPGFGGPVFRLPLGRRFSLFADARAGYYYWGPGGWDAEGVNGGGLTFGGSAGGLFRIGGPFTLGAGVSYDYYAKLYNGLSFRLSVRLDFPALERERGTVELRKIKLMPLFPVLFSYYDNHPVGTARVINTGKRKAEDITLQFFVERYMDNPMEVGAPFSLEPGEEKTVTRFALFTEDLMEVTEGTKASAKITVSYPGRRDDYTRDYTGVLEFYNRNAMMWDDDRKIASFITAKDPEIMNFAKNVVTWMQTVKNPAVDENLQKGMAVFEAVRLYGIQYEIDPTTPFSEFSENETAIDFLQFPRQTLQYTNGDCDDLTALYTALLESVGVETAFITVPGHIYAAFALKAPPEEMQKALDKPEELIIQDEKAWIPVEITMFQDSFEEAWQTGAKEWREHSSKEQAELFPTRECWGTFPAVGFKEGASGIELPDKGRVTDAVKECIGRHVEQQIYPRVAALEKKLKQNPSAISYRNKLAVVYARYGLYDKALEQFQRILYQREYTPALTNTGNIYFIRKEYQSALKYYNRALEQNSRNRSALVGIARCNHELENYGLVKKTYEQIKDLDPDLAERYAYLDLKGGRADRALDAAGLQTIVVWQEEE